MKWKRGSDRPSCVWLPTSWVRNPAEHVRSMDGLWPGAAFLIKASNLSVAIFDILEVTAHSRIPSWNDGHINMDLAEGYVCTTLEESPKTPDTGWTLLRARIRKSQNGDTRIQ